MFTPRNDDDLEVDLETASAGPVRQRKSLRASAAKRSRQAVRRKTRASHKSGKVGGMHQRANKRMSW
jgi:hypothetical protein